ncbi:uncharacterized protein DUF742 [Actinomadura pelletieri DSM 43383]|uniref:Uncharacterized protein DUF742 n=1 Tax=Actinomadura pelletieri DSM 43383 TaxID=1120940 RepID=A0A495QG06_9ACTN|nr:DUF742 domain-containing protein [Actinomadura pelletieri]RKS70846.1 uncharacterized protein DUF742 [Actinomadura pelletieri DSM 43383]
MMPPEDPTPDFWSEDPPQPPAPAPAPENAERWLDDRAGPMVRPYVMTSGRIEPSHGKFDLITLVVAVGVEPDTTIGLGPEHLAIIRLCQNVMSVAELTGHLDLPVATVRVMLGDLLDKGFVSLQEPEPEADMHDIRLYKAVIDGLRAL